jgi:endonuclease YncB( thermonuclease family)
MPFTLIKGGFRVVGYKPDGDSIRFEPDDRTLLQRLDKYRPGWDTARVQLRIEAIDSLETHYGAGGGTLHQPKRWAHAARDHLLAFTGVGAVQWDDRGATVVCAANDGARGYILSRAFEKNKRPVAFVFAGDAPEEDGADVRLLPDRLEQSFNYRALADGMAYPTFYQGLFADLRKSLSDAASRAQQAGEGLWADDVTQDGFDADDMNAITERHVIMPKLFRRLADYIALQRSASGFKESMMRSREPVLDLVEANFTHFDTFIDQAAGSTRIALRRRPQELVFDPMPQRPTEAFRLVAERPALVFDELTEAQLFPEGAMTTLSA